jgi:acetyl-CoA acetyltransferase
MVVGLPAEELEKRKAQLGAEAMMNAVPAPLQGLSKHDLEAEAVRRAIADAGLKASDIDGAVKVSGGPRSGRGMAEIAGEQYDIYPRTLGLPVNFYYRAGRGGAWGAFGISTALAFLELGLAKYVAVAGSRSDWTISHSRQERSASYRAGHSVTHTTPEGTWGKTFGANTAAHNHSNYASRHSYEYGTREEDFGNAAIQIRKWACMNPLARMFNRPATMEDYFNSPVYVDPYHFMDMSQTTDGAIAFILTSTDRAKSLAQHPVEILGVGVGDAQGGQWFEGPAHYKKLIVGPAKQAAFSQAGITLDDVDCAQLYDCFTGEVLLQLEDYGWCEKGEVGAFLADEGIGPGGRIPINTGGGMLSAYHFADMTGLSEAVVQLRGLAGERQVKDAEISFATGHGGEVMAPGMCSIHTTVVLGRSR